MKRMNGDGVDNRFKYCSFFFFAGSTEYYQFGHFTESDYGSGGWQWCMSRCGFLVTLQAATALHVRQSIQDQPSPSHSLLVTMLCLSLRLWLSAYMELFKISMNPENMKLHHDGGRATYNPREKISDLQNLAVLSESTWTRRPVKVQYNRPGINHWTVRPLLKCRFWIFEIAPSDETFSKINDPNGF